MLSGWWVSPFTGCSADKTCPVDRGSRANPASSSLSSLELLVIKAFCFFSPCFFPQVELFVVLVFFCSHPLPCTQDRAPGCCSLLSLGHASPGLRHSDATCIRSRILLCLGWECCQGLVFLLTAVSKRSQYIAVSSHGEGQVSLQAEVLQ